MSATDVGNNATLEQAKEGSQRSFEPCAKLELKTIDGHFERTGDEEEKGLSKTKARETCGPMEVEACEMIMDPSSWLDAKLEENPFTGIVFYLGDW